jgi:hypothetical protein
MFSSIISAIISLAACAFAAPTVPAATNPISFAGNPAEYMKGFKNPRIDTSAGGKANCISGTVDVKASANNVHIQLQEPATQAVLTEFLIEAVEINSTLIERITGGPTHVCGTFGIYSQLCFPLGKINATTIQFLTPGAGADQSYWNIAPEYSYVDYAAEQGYITFLYDRLGTGLSDHPDPIQIVQVQLQVAIAHELVRLLRPSPAGNSTLRCGSRTHFTRPSTSFTPQ